MFDVLNNKLNDFHDWWKRDFRPIKVWMERYREQIKFTKNLVSTIITLALLTMFFMVLGFTLLVVICIMIVVIFAAIFIERSQKFHEMLTEKSGGIRGLCR